MLDDFLNEIENESFRATAKKIITEYNKRNSDFEVFSKL